MYIYIYTIRIYMPLIFPWNPHEVVELCWHHHGHLYRFLVTGASTQTAQSVALFVGFGIGRRGRGEAEEWQVAATGSTNVGISTIHGVFRMESHRTKWWISSQPCLIAGIPKWQFEWRNLDKIMSHGKFGVPNLKPNSIVSLYLKSNMEGSCHGGTPNHPPY